MRLGKKIQLLLISSLITLASMPISPAFGAILKMADFETGDFSQFQNPTLLPNNVSAEGGSISVVTTRAYDGIYSAGASVPSGSGNKYARTIWELTSLGGRHRRLVRNGHLPAGGLQERHAELLRPYALG